MNDEEVKIKLNLTDSEWVQLIDGNSEDSQLQVCCGNISALRDEFVSLVRNGRNKGISSWNLTDLKQKLGWVANGHELTPLLIKVCDQIGFDYKAEIEHDKQNFE